MDSLSLDNFRQQQDYQRALFVPSRKKHHKKHHKHKSRKHRSSRHHHSHRHGHSHSHRSRRSKSYGSVNDQCAVCLDDETELDTRLFPCKHAFHGECLIEWVKQGENFTCPLCRQKISHFFNLSPNKEINDELVSIWNDYYVNIDSLGSSSTPRQDDKIGSDSGATSKGLSTIPENGAAKEEIAKLKNKEINEALGIVVTEGAIESPIEIEVVPSPQLKTKTDSETETNTKTKKTQIGTVVTDLIPSPIEKEDILSKTRIESIETVIQTKETEKIVDNKIANVWNSMWCKMKKKDIGSGKEKTNPLVKVLLPNNGIVSSLFDENIKHVLITSEKEEEEEEKNNYKMIDTIENSSIDDYKPFGFDVENEIDRINEARRKGIFDDNNNNDVDGGFSEQSEKTSVGSPSGYGDILDKVRVKKHDEILKNTTTNMEAGIYAGIAAGLVAYTLNHSQHRMMPYLMRSSLLPTMKQTIPNVATFFTIFEHLKSYGFDLDNNNKSPNESSHFINFSQRFLSAGIASSVAFLPRNQALTSIGLKIALPLRFATFFGSFEFCKDIAMQWKIGHSMNTNTNANANSNSLNLFEIGASAAVGSVIASGVHYPLTQFIQHGGNSMLNNGNIVVNGNTGSAVSFMNVNKSVMFETMYRGWISHLTRFIPTTVACSCAFEFGKRAVCHRKD